MKAYKVMFVISLQAWRIHQGSNNRWVCQAEVQKCSQSWSWVSYDTVYLPNSFYVLICESVMVLGLLTSVSGYCILLYFPQSRQMCLPRASHSLIDLCVLKPCVFCWALLVCLCGSPVSVCVSKFQVCFVLSFPSFGFVSSVLATLTFCCMSSCWIKLTHISITCILGPLIIPTWLASQTVTESL